MKPLDLAHDVYKWLISRLEEKMEVENCSSLIKFDDLIFCTVPKAKYYVRFSTLKPDDPIFFDKCLKKDRFQSGRAFTVIMVASFDVYTRFLDALDAMDRHSVPEKTSGSHRPMPSLKEENFEDDLHLMSSEELSEEDIPTKARGTLDRHASEVNKSSRKRALSNTNTATV